MDQNRWKVVNAIFHAALEVPLSERQRFIAQASGGDEELETEVVLLLKADEEAGSYIEAPLVPFGSFSLAGSQFQPGDVLCGRFRLVRAIDEGGMGHVFEAFDSELRTQVAIKVIRPEIATNAEALSRFRQEVRLARQVTHPNVCRTFDLEREVRPVGVAGDQQEAFFLTMEYLPGESLAARIRREGPLPLDETRRFAQHIANALEAAHALGVVHRDIKPGNIMLTPAAEQGLRAVVTDFGLAQAAKTEGMPGLSGITHGANPIGTLAYMAPEQLEGGPASIATDIYAFGLVLFEMVTGRRAYPSDNLLSGIAQRLTGPPPDPALAVPDLPECWRRAILGCLRLKQKERFACAAEVVAALDERGKRGYFWWPLPAWWSGRRIATAALILIAAAALFWGGLRYAGSRSDAKLAPGTLVYLAPVKNETGEKALHSITELIRAGLSQSAQINLLEQGRIEETLQRMTRAPGSAIDAPIGREIAMRTGAARVVFVDVSRSNGEYRLDVDLEQPDNTPARARHAWTKSFTWQKGGGNGGAIPPQLLAAVRDASDWVRREAGESQSDIARLSEPPGNVTTGDWAALTAFAQGEKFLGQNKMDEAIASYRDAIRNDPGFSLAYARIGDVLVSRSRLAEGYRAYISALNTDAGQRLTRKERDFIRGSYASDTHDYATALDAFRDYSAFYPSDFTGWFYQAFPLDMLDRSVEAIQVLTRAQALSDSSRDAAGGLAYSNMVLGQFEESRRWIQQLRNVGRADKALLLQAFDEFLEKDFAGSARSFEELEGSSSLHYRSDGFAGQARIQAEQGNYSGALSTIDKALHSPDIMENDGDRSQRWLDYAYISCRMKQFGPCLNEISTALRLDENPDAIIWAGDIIGSCYRDMPRLFAQEALAMLEKMNRILPAGDLGTVYTIARNRTQGEIFIARGDTANALLAFRKADILDAPLGARDYLARGLLAQAAHEAVRSKARVMQEEALAFYEKSAARPALIWRNAMAYPPGFAADQMEHYLALTQHLQVDNSKVRSVEALLNDLRPIHAARKGVDDPH